MNYYPFHLGDYATHTAHLEPMEDLAYRRMLDLYYRTESPLPQDPAEIARLIRLRDEAATVRDVLNEFFEATPDGWRHARCDSEIAKYKTMADGGRKGAAKRWAKPGHSPPMPYPSPPQCHPNANQEPRTKNQNQEPRAGAVDLPCEEKARPPDQVEDQPLTPSLAGRACLACRGANVHDANPAHPTLLRLLAAGVTPEEIGATAVECSAAGKPRFAYVLATVERRRSDAARAPPAAEARPATVPMGHNPADDFHAKMNDRAATATKPPPGLRRRLSG